MPIEFACPKCKKQYRVKVALAGKSAKCGKCAHRMKVPQPAAAVTATDSEAPPNNDLGSWLDEELGSGAPVHNKANSARSGVVGNSNCTACGSPLSDGAVICVACGFDLRAGKKLSTKRVVEAGDDESKVRTAAKVTATFSRGVLFSAIGAAIGAAVWVGVAVATDREFGWIAWGLGLAAGGGMALGHDDDDGTMAGITAAGISILGIFGAKFVIFEQLKTLFADAGISLDALEAIAGEPITFWSLLGPIDGLFILLAVGSAYKIGSGKVMD